MANPRHPTSGAIGTFTNEPLSSAIRTDLGNGIGDQYALGTVLYGADNTQWVLGSASESVTGTCTFNASTFAITDAAGNHTTPNALSAGDHAWVYLTAGASA